ncbi:MAG: SDR family NAD(P)-dependent oxidoreductase [Nannocystaceae bacterium]|nr:SDR family NAD(P)-dependent oxidoreductase [Nannocystaceae bacterium]
MSRIAPTLGRRSTAEDALAGASLRGRRILVTGANSGLGVETTRVLAQGGADVILACRDVRAGERVAQGLREGLRAGAGRLELLALDLADLRSVAAAARTLRDDGRGLDVLINNAGVMATPRGSTAQGHELQLGTNHLGHFALTLALAPLLHARAGARVVTLSSSLHRQGRGERMMATLRDDPGYARRKYRPFAAYGDAKLANLLFARALARRWPDVASFAVHPGVIPTPLSRSMGTGGVLFRLVGRPFMKSVAQGAATTVFAATHPALAGHSGAYLADCGLDTPSAQAQDDALAQALWQASEDAIAAADVALAQAG